MRMNFKPMFMIFVLIIVVSIPAFLQAQNSVTFHVSNMQALTVTGPWVFDADNPGFPVGFQDNQC